MNIFRMQRPPLQNRRSLATDKNLRVKGSGGSIFALGDCATIERPRSIGKAVDLFRRQAVQFLKIRVKSLKHLLPCLTRLR